MDRLTEGQKGQKRERKGARSDAYDDLKHRVQGGPSREQQLQDYANDRLPSEPRPKVTRPDEALRGTGAYDGQVRRQALEEVAAKEWDDAHPATGSAAKHSPEEQKRLMDRAAKTERANIVHRSERTSYRG